MADHNRVLSLSLLLIGLQFSVSKSADEPGNLQVTDTHEPSLQERFPPPWAPGLNYNPCYYGGLDWNPTDLCDTYEAYYALSTQALKYCYKYDPHVRKIADGLYRCDPDGFEKVLDRVTSLVKSPQNRYSYHTLIDNFMNHTYIGQRIRGLRVIYSHMKRNDCAEGSMILILAEKLREEEIRQSYGDYDIQEMIRDLKERLPPRVVDIIWNRKPGWCVDGGYERYDVCKTICRPKLESVPTKKCRFFDCSDKTER